MTDHEEVKWHAHWDIGFLLMMIALAIGMLCYLATSNRDRFEALEKRIEVLEKTGS
jgi:hypothetical protein